MDNYGTPIVNDNKIVINGSEYQVQGVVSECVIGMGREINKLKSDRDKMFDRHNKIVDLLLTQIEALIESKKK